MARLLRPLLEAFAAGYWPQVGISAIVCVLLASSFTRGEVLLDDKFADGSRAESKRPSEAAVWVGRPADVSTAKNVLSTKLGESSQKIWTYFTEKEPITLAVGQKLLASVSFIPRGTLSEGTSRSLRLGIFHDPSSPRVEGDTSDDGGGIDKPWIDSQGYAVQVLVSGDKSSRTKPFDLGKRTNQRSEKLLGTSGDYTKFSGGSPVALTLDEEYTITLEAARVSNTQLDLTASYSKGKEQLASFKVSDDGQNLGTDPLCDKFDQLYLRIGNNTTTSDQIDFTNFKVIVIDTAQSSSP